MLNWANCCCSNKKFKFLKKIDFCTKRELEFKKTHTRTTRTTRTTRNKMAQAFVSFVAQFASDAKALEAAVKALGCNVVQDANYIQILVPPFNVKEKKVLEYAHETILDKESLRVVSFGLPKVRHVGLDQVGATAASEISATVVKVGTVVRVFYCARTQTWRLTSSGGPFDAHAHFAYDCAHSVGELFERCLGRIYGHQMDPFNELPIAQLLDPKKTYHFLLQHKGLHRDFVQHPTLFIVAVYQTEDMVFVPAVADKLPTLQDIVFKSTSELTAFVAEMSKTDSSIIGVTFTVADTCHKVFTDRFIRDMALLGNNKTSNLYLICLHNLNLKQDEELLDRFPSLGAYMKQTKVWRGKVAEMVMGGFNKSSRSSSSSTSVHIQPLVKELHEKKLYQTNHLGIKFVTYEIVNAFLDTVVGPERLNVLFNGLEYYQAKNMAATNPSDLFVKPPAPAAVAKKKEEVAAAPAATVVAKKKEEVAAAPAAATVVVKKEQLQPVVAPAAATVVVKKEVAVAPAAAPAAAPVAATVVVKKEPLHEQQEALSPVQLRKQKAYLKGLVASYLSQKIALAQPYDGLFIVSRMMELPLPSLKMLLADKWALCDFIDKHYTQLRNGLEEHHAASQLRLTPAEVANFQNPLFVGQALERKKAAYVRDYVVMPYLAKKYAAMLAPPAMLPFDMLFIVFRLLDLDWSSVIVMDEWTLMSTIDQYYNELRTWVDDCAQEQFLNIQLSTTDMLFFIKYHQL